MASFRDLMVWQKAMRLVTEIYRLSRAFPPDERFGPTSQLRRCVVFIPSNIAEGHARNSSGDYVWFLRVAAGSLYEMETQIEVASNLGYLDPKRFETTVASRGEIGRMLGSLIRTVEGATRSPSKFASKRCP